MKKNTPIKRYIKSTIPSKGKKLLLLTSKVRRASSQRESLVQESSFRIKTEAKREETESHGEHHSLRGGDSGEELKKKEHFQMKLKKASERKLPKEGELGSMQGIQIRR